MHIRRHSKASSNRTNRRNKTYSLLKSSSSTTTKTLPILSHITTVSNYAVNTINPLTIQQRSLTKKAVVSGSYRGGRTLSPYHSFGEDSSSSFEEADSPFEEMLIPIDMDEKGVISPGHIAAAVTEALEKANAQHNNLDFSRIRVQAMMNDAETDADTHFDQVASHTMDISPPTPSITLKTNLVKDAVNQATLDGIHQALKNAQKRHHSPPTSHDIPVRDAMIPPPLKKTYHKITASTPTQPADTEEILSLMDLSRDRLSRLSAPEIVAHLDAHVIAQDEAKKALSIAVRNRERRFRLLNSPKPDSISAIEEVGIKLARKYGYTLRQELFTQIGHPTIYSPSTDPICSRQTPEPVYAQQTQKHPEKSRSNITSSFNTSVTNQTLQQSTSIITGELSSPLQQQLQYRFSHLSQQDTDRQNELLTLNNKSYGGKLAQEINPFNILMIGPTGSGKSELVKRLCHLLDAPYTTADATRYTETGVVGNDIDQIVQDLYKDALEREKKMEIQKVMPVAKRRAVSAVVNAIRDNDNWNKFFTFLDSRGLSHLVDNFSPDPLPPKPSFLLPSSIANDTHSTLAPIPTATTSTPLCTSSETAISQSPQKSISPPTPSSLLLETISPPSSHSAPKSRKKHGRKNTAPDDIPPPTVVTASTVNETILSPPDNSESTHTPISSANKNDFGPANAQSAGKSRVKNAPKKLSKKHVQKVQEAIKSAFEATAANNTPNKTTNDSKFPKQSPGKPLSSTDAKFIDDLLLSEDDIIDTRKSSAKSTKRALDLDILDKNSNQPIILKRNNAKHDATKAVIDQLSTISTNTPPSSSPTTTASRRGRPKGAKNKKPLPSTTPSDHTNTSCTTPETTTPSNQRKRATTKYDDDDSGLFSTELDDESSYYQKVVKPLMFEKLNRKYRPSTTLSPENPSPVTAGNFTEPTPTKTRYIPTVDELKKWVDAGYLNDYLIDVPLPVPSPPKATDANNAHALISFEELVNPNAKPKTKMKTKHVSVAHAMDVLSTHHANEMVNEDELHDRALKNAERNGVIFIDEIDKLIPGETRTTSSTHKGEGVQRELLSLLQGKTVKRGNLTIQTENILFICAGAFHHAGPGQLLPELQGRLPVVTKLNPLTQIQLALVLTIPVYSVLKQYITLMKADGIDIHIDDEAIWEMSQSAADLNERSLNLGARRLHNVINSVFGYISYNYANGLRLQVDDLGRLHTITSNDQELAARNDLKTDSHNTSSQGQNKLQNSKSATNTLSINIAPDADCIDILPNGETRIVITKEYVKKTLSHMMQQVDISKFLL